MDDFLVQFREEMEGLDDEAVAAVYLCLDSVLSTFVDTDVKLLPGLADDLSGIVLDEIVKRFCRLSGENPLYCTFSLLNDENRMNPPES